ncbi:hypothetical protein C1752_12059 [Acaryochloris thomasi RCC1774]|uniref:Integrase catalytic domain-containing protein n=2 Tax=Acaryochloris TaxID=155977 RepID=A0A2W1J8K6_9CYAN|nr:hypothetical protein C1752_12059 [Acaryochloris thomasi RCC1774]
MLAERGVSVDHTTIYRWVQRYSPELDARCRRHLRSTNDSWKLDETYIDIKGRSYYLWRAIDSSGFMLDFLLTARRDTQAAKRFLRKVLQREHVEQFPRVINTDKYVVYPRAIEELQESGELSEECEHRPVKYLNNLLEQDHRFVKLRVKAGLGFQDFWSAKRTIRGYETMNAIRKGQIVGVEKGDIRSQNHFICDIFGVAV